MLSPRIAVLAVAAVCTLAGCGAHGRLAEVDSELAPEEGEKAAECQEFGAFGIDYPSYECTYYVPGAQAEVTLRMAARLEEEGFVVRCRWGSHEEVEMQGGRDTLDVYVDVSRRGSKLDFSELDEPLTVYPPGDPYASERARPIPAGTVIVSIDVGDYEEYRWPDESAPECDRAFLASRDEEAGSD
jgi:hypothetical protein